MSIEIVDSRSRADHPGHSDHPTVSTGLKEALWWTVVFVVIAVVIAAGVRLVAWITEGETANVWKAALSWSALRGAGGAALTKFRRAHNGDV